MDRHEQDAVDVEGSGVEPAWVAVCMQGTMGTQGTKHTSAVEACLGGWTTPASSRAQTQTRPSRA